MYIILTYFKTILTAANITFLDSSDIFELSFLKHVTIIKLPYIYTGYKLN